MKSAEVKPATSSKSGPGKPFFTGAGEVVQEQEGRPAFFNYGKPIQAKLSIGRAGDSYEREADATADRVVMRLAEPGGAGPVKGAEKMARGAEVKTLGPARGVMSEQEENAEKEKETPEKRPLQKKPIFDSNAEPPPAPPADSSGTTIRRKCAACEAEERRGAAGREDHVHPMREMTGIRKCEACDGKQMVQKSDATAGGTSGGGDFESRLNSSNGGGSPLPEGTRAQMESSFGADFSGVRVHTDSGAAEMSGNIHAQAFTHGSDIYFNSGKYDPQSKEGQHLLAHELTHTMQQGAAVKRRQEHADPAAADKMRLADPAAPGIQKDDDDTWWDSVKSFGSSVASEAGDLAGDVKEGVSDAAHYVKDKAVAFGHAVKEGVSEAIDFIRNLVQKSLAWVRNTWATVKNFVTGAITSIKETWLGLVEFFKAPLSNIANAMESLDPVAVDAGWQGFLTWVENKWTSFKAVGEMVLGQARAFWSGISSYVDGVFAKIESVTNGSVFQSLPGIVQSGANMVIDGFRDAWGLIQDEWDGLYGTASDLVHGFYRLGDEFLEKLTSIPIKKIVDFVRQFGAFIKKIIEIWHNPNLLIDPVLKWLADKLKDAPTKFLAEIDKQIAANKVKKKKENKGKMPSRYSLNDYDIALGVVRAALKKWRQMELVPMLKDMVLSMFWPPATYKAIGQAWDECKKDIKEVWVGLYHVDSLQDFWTNLLHLTDIVVILWRFLNNVVGLLFIYLMILLIIGGGILGGVFGVGAGAVPGMMAGAALAEEIGGFLLISFLAAEASNLELQYYILATGLNTENQQETAFNKIADSIIGLVTAGILAILTAIAARIASGLMSAARSIFSKLSEMLGDAAEDVKGKPGEVKPGGDGEGGSGEGKPEGEGGSGQGEKNNPDIDYDSDPNVKEVGEAKLEKPLMDLGNDEGSVAMDADGDCEICHSPCKKIMKEFGSVMDDATKAKIEKIQKMKISNAAKEERLKPIIKDLEKFRSYMDDSGRLKPNQEFEFVAEHKGYFGESDEFGRLKRIWTDDLKLSEYDRLAHERESPGKVKGDQAGHMFGDRFGGSRKLDNILSQLRKVNLSEYKSLENEWAQALEAGKDVTVDADIEYDPGDSDPDARPSEFVVNYTVGGKKQPPVKIPNI